MLNKVLDNFMKNSLSFFSSRSSRGKMPPLSEGLKLFSLHSLRCRGPGVRYIFHRPQLTERLENIDLAHSSESLQSVKRRGYEVLSWFFKRIRSALFWCNG
jgi:hypothetical protein